MEQVLFVAIVKYVKPLKQIDAALAEHRKFLDKYYDLNKIVCSGAQNPRVGGVILFKGGDRADVWSIIRQDPFYVQGLAEYDVTEFTARRWGSIQENI